MTKPVIIGYGNPLRQDDGVAWHAIDIIESLLPPGLVDFYCCHNLTPEIAAQLEDASLVILLDAKVGDSPDEIEVSPLSPHCFSAWSHDIQPRDLLSIARDLFAVTPPAFLITAAVSSFGFDDRLTPHGERCAALMARRAIELVFESQSTAALDPHSAPSDAHPTQPRPEIRPAVDLNPAPAHRAG